MAQEGKEDDFKKEFDLQYNSQVKSNTFLFLFNCIWNVICLVFFFQSVANKKKNNEDAQSAYLNLAQEY